MPIREIPQDIEGITLVDMSDAELDQMKRQSDFDKINDRRIRSGYQPMWAYFRYIQEVPNYTLEDLEYIAKRLNFKYGWAHHKWKEKQERVHVRVVQGCATNTAHACNKRSG